uniref:Uncharacterized protein n=1 Tax=Mimivirus LCMiAC02 TaxID=2506609 RepID=A0A4P6VME5_9VIRU|nr:MAG: hypothetical protein LCMiAC02_04650 [Mimivirus LCMiAC02]
MSSTDTSDKYKGFDSKGKTPPVHTRRMDFTTCCLTVFDTICDIANIGAYKINTLRLLMTSTVLLTLLNLIGMLVRVVWYVNNSNDDVLIIFRLDVVFLTLSFILIALVTFDWFTKRYDHHNEGMLAMFGWITRRVSSTRSYPSIRKRQNDEKKPFVIPPALGRKSRSDYDIPDEMMKSYIRFGNYIVMMATVFSVLYGLNWAASILWRVFVGGLRN